MYYTVVMKSKKIFAIGASNSSTSINKQLASYIAHQLQNVSVIELDWNNLVLPVYGPDLEEEIGIPESAIAFKKMIDDAEVRFESQRERVRVSQSGSMKELEDKLMDKLQRALDNPLAD